MFHSDGEQLTCANYMQKSPFYNEIQPSGVISPNIRASTVWQILQQQGLMKNFQGRDSIHSSSKKDSEYSRRESCSPVSSPLEGSNENKLKDYQSKKDVVQQSCPNSDEALSQSPRRLSNYKRDPVSKDLNKEFFGGLGQPEKRPHCEIQQINNDTLGLQSTNLKKSERIFQQRKEGRRVLKINKQLGLTFIPLQKSITQQYSDRQPSLKPPPLRPLNSVSQKEESDEHNQTFQQSQRKILEKHADEHMKENVETHDHSLTTYQNNKDQGHSSPVLKQVEPIFQEWQEGQKAEKTSEQLEFDANSQQQRSLIPDSSDRHQSSKSAPLSHSNEIIQNDEISDSDKLFSEQLQMGTEQQRQQRKSNSAKLGQLSIFHSSKYMTPEEHKIFTEGFQSDENLFSRFFAKIGSPLFSLIEQKQKPKLAVDLLKQYGLKSGSDLNRKTFVSMMADKRLENFWKSLIEEKNIMDRLLPKKQRSNIQKKYSKLEFIIEKVFETKRFESFFEYKDELIEAAKQLKAMRDNGQLPKEEEVHSKYKYIWNELSEEERSLAFKAYQRTKFDVRSFIHAFRKIMIKIVNDNIQSPSNLIRTEISKIEKKRKMSISDCKFLFCHWQFCKIWPKTFQQDLINKQYLQLNDAESLRVQQYSTMTVLFQKLYRQKNFTDIYKNKELFLELAERIVNGKKSQYFEKKPRDFWKNFDSEELEAKRKKKFQKKNEKQSKSQSQGQFKFQKLFRAEKKALIEKLMEEEPNSNYDEILKSQKFVKHLNKVYQSAFYKLFLQKMSKEGIQNDEELNNIFLQSEYLAQKGYYRILTHPEMQKELRQALKEKKLSKYILEDKKELKYITRIYYEFQEIFSGIFESLVKK